MTNHVISQANIAFTHRRDEKRAKGMASATVFALLLTSSLLLTVRTPVLVAAAATTISVEPVTTTVTQTGQRFEINVTIAQVADLAGWDFRLYYLNSILNATGIEEGSFLKTAGSTFFLNKSCTDYYNATHGLIWCACALIGNGTGASGNGTLAEIEFEARSYGNSVLKIGETDLVDSSYPPNHIPHTVQDGIVRVLRVDDVAVTQVVPFKTVVGESYCLSVNITVENQGRNQETFNVTLEASKPDTSIANFHLFGSATNGWGFDYDNITSPGPTLTVKKGDIVNMTLTTRDGLVHNFFVDYDGDTYPDQGEPISPDFPQAPYYEWTINYQFTADTLGNFPYYCKYEQSVMFGTFVVLPPTMLTREVAQQRLTLDSGISTNLTILWNTTTFAYGNYTVTGIADVVQGENDTADNTCISSTCVHIGVPGDVTSAVRDIIDGRVDVRDITGLILKFNARPGDQLWNANYDVNDDTVINVKDITIAILHFMQHE
jgi:plastocyanin